MSNTLRHSALDCEVGGACTVTWCEPDATASRHPPPPRTSSPDDSSEDAGARPSGDHAISRATTSGRWFGWRTARVESSAVDLRGVGSGGKGTPASSSSSSSASS